MRQVFFAACRLRHVAGILTLDPTRTPTLGAQSPSYRTTTEAPQSSLTILWYLCP